MLFVLSRRNPLTAGEWLKETTNGSSTSLLVEGRNPLTAGEWLKGRQFVRFGVVLGGRNPLTAGEWLKAIGIFCQIAHSELVAILLLLANG